MRENGQRMETTVGEVAESFIAEQSLSVIAPSGMGPLLERYAKDEKVPRAWGAGMAVLLATKGEDGLLDEVTDDLLEGCEIRQIAENRGVKVGELARWIFATVEREAAYRGMLRVKADLLMHQTIGIVDGVDTDGENAGAKVAHAKLRADVYARLASKWDRAYYGEDKASVNVGVGVKFVISADDAGVL